jgi:uncharacterized protein (TIGR00369 family)
MTIDELEGFLAREFPQLFEGGRSFRIEGVSPGSVKVRMHIDERHLRPGGTISGPAMFALADVALYVAILAALGPVALAVTTNLTINFLRKPEPRDIIAETQLLKLGKRLAVGQVLIVPADGGEPVAHATGTYSIPPARPDRET